MTIDIFVHPKQGTREKPHYPDKNLYCVYLNHLVDVAKRSDHPILIKGYYDHPELEALIPETSHFRTCWQKYHDMPAFESGVMTDEDWDSFVESVKPLQDIRIHGAFLGQCAEGIAVQLFASLTFGERWFADENTQEHEMQLLARSERKGLFRRSGIKYGVILEPALEKVEMIKPPICKLFKGFSRYLMETSPARCLT